jgi:hypothetical protein
MTSSSTKCRLGRLAACLPLIVAPLLLAATSPVYAEPGRSTDLCAGVAVSPGYTCVPSPKQCFRAPCPQYDLVPIGLTGPGFPFARARPLG